MTAKEYIGQAYRIDQRINSKLEQVISLRELASKATSTITDMPHSASPNLRSMQDIISNMVDLENEINADIDALLDLKHDIVTTIQGVESPEYRTLLELRYLCFKPWEQIALEMSYSLQHTFRIHDNALKSITIPAT